MSPSLVCHVIVIYLSTQNFNPNLFFLSFVIVGLYDRVVYVFLRLLFRFWIVAWWGSLVTVTVQCDPSLEDIFNNTTINNMLTANIRHEDRMGFRLSVRVRRILDLSLIIDFESKGSKHVDSH